MPQQEFEHDGERIIVFSPTSVRYYLFNEDGDIDEYYASSVDEARARIDDYHKRH